MVTLLVKAGMVALVRVALEVRVALQYPIVHQVFLLLMPLAHSLQAAVAEVAVGHSVAQAAAQVAETVVTDTTTRGMAQRLVAQEAL